MLTKDLLLYRIRDGRVRPSFLDATDPALLSLAESMIAIASHAAGEERGVVEERLEARAAAGDRPKIGQGLAKLLVDRMEFEEPSDEAPRLRETSFATAADVLRALPDDATPEQFETALRAAVPELDAVRQRLYADHPDERKLLSWKELGPRALLDRWNLAQVQGLLLQARRVSVRAFAPDLVRVRRVLRWLKFCRLVAEVRTTADDWSLDVEGPAEILAMARKYGLQLAIFAEAVPLLERWELSAEIRFGHGRPALLQLDHRAPLVAPTQALGHVPEEIGVIARRLEDGDWEVELTPTPRTVGLGSLCVPDLSVRHRGSGRVLHVEFFHRWHRHALARRLADLRTRPDPELLLGVDEGLLGEPELRAEVEAHPQTMTFRGFPSERRLRSLLARHVEA